AWKERAAPGSARTCRRGSNRWPDPARRPLAASLRVASAPQRACPRRAREAGCGGQPCPTNPRMRSGRPCSASDTPGAFALKPEAEQADQTASESSLLRARRQLQAAERKLAEERAANADIVAE